MPGVGSKAGLAQLAEQLICNQQVVGSNPSAGSNATPGKANGNGQGGKRKLSVLESGRNGNQSLDLFSVDLGASPECL